MKFWEAVSTLVGMIIGAGVLGLPFVIAQVGIVPGLVLLLVVGLASLLLNLMFTEVVLRTKQRHQVAGYAKKYLGNKVKYLEIASMVVNGYGILLAYIIGSGVALSAMFGGSAFVYGLIFFAVMGYILFFGLKIVKVFELWMVFIFIVVMAIILGISGYNVNYSNFAHIDISKTFLAYGVVLFAFSGAAAVVPLREVLRKSEKKIKKAVIIASIAPIILYALFCLAVVGVTGLTTTEVATVGLGQKIGTYMILFGNLFAIFAMATSFLSKGVILKELFMFDFKLSRLNSWLLILIPPLLLFIFGLHNFIATLGIVGGLSMGISGSIMVVLFWKAKKMGDRKPEFSLPKFKVAGGALLGVFILGLIYTVWNMISG
jgi:tyrosine-specific transport protein